MFNHQRQHRAIMAAARTGVEYTELHSDEAEFRKESYYFGHEDGYNEAEEDERTGKYKPTGPLAYMGYY